MLGPPRCSPTTIRCSIVIASPDNVIVYVGDARVLGFFLVSVLILVVLSKYRRPARFP